MINNCRPPNGGIASSSGKRSISYAPKLAESPTQKLCSGSFITMASCFTAPGCSKTRSFSIRIGPWKRSTHSSTEIRPCRCSGVSRSQLQLPVQTAHFVIGFKVDHFLPPCFCRKSSTIALSDRGLMAPIAWASEADAVRCGLAFILRQVSFQAQELIEGPLVGDQSQLDQFPARS